VFADWIAPHDPFNLATLELERSMLPPAWMEGGAIKYPLGTDEQAATSCRRSCTAPDLALVGGASVLVSLVVGVAWAALPATSAGDSMR
jgi:peptide/nickel transport system permease protein